MYNLTAKYSVEGLSNEKGYISSSASCYTYQCGLIVFGDFEILSIILETILLKLH